MKFLDLTGLSSFWTKAKQWVTTEITSATNTLKQSLTLSNISDVTASATEVNHIKGVTSAVQTQIDAKAPLASPQLSGVPTAPTAESGTNTTQLATTAFVKTAVDAGVSSVKTQLGSVLKYKGSKDTYAQLPESAQNETGDVWNVVAKNGKIPAGTNYAWNGSDWDPLGGEIDLSNFVTEEDFEAISSTEIESLFS